jgi:hypothetical protein
MPRINKETQVITDDFTLDEDFRSEYNIDGVLNFHFYEDDDKIVNLMIGAKSLGFISVDALEVFLKAILEQLQSFHKDSIKEEKVNGST